MSPDLPPAGWYPNPDGSRDLRWWSGVGWTEYTRAGQAPPVPQATPDEAAPEQPAPPAASAWTGHAQDTSTQPTAPLAPGGWGQPPAPVAPGYTPYAPVAASPLTPSGMRPLNGMFTDIGRIVRRGWLPILGISLAIWAVVSVVYIGALLAFVDLSALERGVDLLSASTSPETGAPTIDAEVSAAFRDAFAALPPAGWALLLAALTVLVMLATAIQAAAVSRLGMDAAAGRPVSWSAGWRSGFTAGFRLFGYSILLAVLVGAAWTVAIVLVAGLAAVSPALGVAVGILALLALIALSVWLTGRLIPVIAQAVVGKRALGWSWAHTRGKFWAVLGRYLLWSIAASIVVNVIVTIISIPVSFLVLGSAANSTSTDQLGASLVLSLLTLPVSFALTAVTLIGIVPIWRDLTDHPEYRSIDAQGQPIS